MWSTIITAKYINLNFDFHYLYHQYCNSQVQYESRSEVDVSLEMLNIREKERFMNGDKDIAIISEAASSGISLQVSIFAVILLENAN